MQRTTLLWVCPAIGWRKRDTEEEPEGEDERASPNGELGPESGRFGSVKTALKDPEEEEEEEGRAKAPCLAVRSPTLHKRGLS